MAYAPVAAINRVHVIPINFEFLFKSVDEMNRVINSDAHTDSSNGDGHHVKRNAEPAHHSQNNTHGKQVWGNGDQGDFNRSEQN